ncbi:MAG: hypothetical protein MK212_06760 [Saprospiraceae bacterium]|nr:hypothetical protein [Saprospiraceae bacterium]
MNILKLNTLVLLLIVLLTACGDKPKPNTNNTKDTPQTQNDKQNPDSDNGDKRGEATPTPNADNPEDSNAAPFQISMTEIKKGDLPFSLDFNPKEDGEIIDLYQIEDASGQSFIVRSFSTTYKKHMMTVEYYKQADDGQGKVISKFGKAISICDFDLINEHKSGGMQVSDVNNDGIAEYTCMFTLDCISDVSPFGLDLVVFEDDQVYSMSGTTKVEGMGGDFDADEMMQSNEALLVQSKGLWKAFCEHKWN